MAFLVLGCLLQYCGEYGTNFIDFKFVNETNDSIVVSFHFSNKDRDFMDYIVYEEIEHVDIGSESTYDTDKYVFWNESLSPDDNNFYYKIYVIKKRDYDIYTKEELIERGLIQAFYSYRYRELEMRNFTLTYSGPGSGNIPLDSIGTGRGYPESLHSDAVSTAE